MARRHMLLLSLMLVAAFALAACGGGGNDGLPQNWERFTEGAFAGALHRDWEELYVDAASLDDGGVELPESVSTAFDAFVESGNSRVFFVYLEQAPTNEFVTYITILRCADAEVVEVVSDPMTLAEYYQSVGVPATPHAIVGFQGRDFVILKLDIAPSYDTYEVYIEKDGCYLPVTLNTRKGESFWVDAYGTFVGFLEPDVTQLKAGQIDSTPTPGPVEPTASPEATDATPAPQP